MEAQLMEARQGRRKNGGERRYGILERESHRIGSGSTGKMCYEPF
ncbi:uncharacterized protein G2W53_044465 [Senna tora]|uniref:Uncharacterized protein n=1 Tax=Senna tora TaxID=362788 RepID=A0A834W084_9FABA|nr:uncharacterized protein G2W53_044465 [Senna tora]